MDLKIVRYPHPALRRRAQPIHDIDRNVRLLARKMLELMYASKGVGLAAPQVAVPYQLIVINLDGSADRPESEMVLINPIVVTRKGIDSDREGCLSLPGLYAEVKRAKEVTLRAYDLEGKAIELKSKGYEARVWQHEIDHLEGILFIDRLTAAASLACKADLKAFQSAYQEAQKRGHLPSDTELEEQLQRQNIPQASV